MFFDNNFKDTKSTKMKSPVLDPSIESAINIEAFFLPFIKVDKFQLCTTTSAMEQCIFIEYTHNPIGAVVKRYAEEMFYDNSYVI